MHSNKRLARNNFDFLRFLFASIVCLVHAYELSDYKQLAQLTHFLSSQVAINAFFVISGFLIFMSYEKSSSLISYANKRIRRIYPAYFTVIMFCAIGLFVVSSKSLANYFSASWISYLVANLSFLNFIQHTLPGVFESNKIPAVNGALWTLKIEVMFYLSVPLIVWFFRKFGRLPVILVFYFLSVLYALIFIKLAEQTGTNIYSVLSRQLPGQLCYFMAGAFFYYYLPVFERNVSYFLVPSIIVLLVNYYLKLPLLEPFALATLVIFCGLFCYLGNFGRYGDFSYGLYILHFPIIQCFIHFGWLKNTPWLFLLTIFITTLIAALAMWHIIEKRFLSRKNYYIVNSNVDT